jgi:hypothetical protein
MTSAHDVERQAPATGLRMAVDDWMTLASAAARSGVWRDRPERAALEGR